MSLTNPPSSAGGPPSAAAAAATTARAAASASATQSLKRSVQAAFDGKEAFPAIGVISPTLRLEWWSPHLKMFLALAVLDIHSPA